MSCSGPPVFLWYRATASDRWPTSRGLIRAVLSNDVPITPVAAARRSATVVSGAPGRYTAEPIATSEKPGMGVTIDEPVSVAVPINDANGERPMPGSVVAQ